MIFTYVKII